MNAQEYEYWSLGLWTKATIGMNRTYTRRPYRNLVKSQKQWMLNRPTLDSLWVLSGADYWRKEAAYRFFVRRIENRRRERLLNAMELRAAV